MIGVCAGGHVGGGLSMSAEVRSSSLSLNLFSVARCLQPLVRCALQASCRTPHDLACPRASIVLVRSRASIMPGCLGASIVPGCLGASIVLGCPRVLNDTRARGPRLCWLAWGPWMDLRARGPQMNSRAGGPRLCWLSGGVTKYIQRLQLRLDIWS